MKLIPLGFLAMGIIILMQVILPLVSFQVWEFRQKMSNQILVSPQDVNRSVLGVSIESKDNFPSFVSYLSRETIPSYSKYTLSSPRLKMEKQTVSVDSNDLSRGLIHLPGSALPGEKGNVFISGHSSISRLLLGQKVPFSNLLDLKKNDEIIIDAGNAKFIYRVVGIKVVDPSDLSVILPPDEQGRYVSLMTCVPPGLNLKRLIVLGKML